LHLHAGNDRIALVGFGVGDDVTIPLLHGGGMGDAGEDATGVGFVKNIRGNNLEDDRVA
jgi:hypothetical protein